MKKWTAAQLQLLKYYWEAAKKAEDLYWSHIDEIEKEAKKVTGIDIELFHSEGLAGIGDYGREYKLVQDDILEGK